MFSRFLVHSRVDHTGQGSRFWLGLFIQCKMWTCILQIPVMGAGREGGRVGVVLYRERLCWRTCCDLLWPCSSCLPSSLRLAGFRRLGQSAHSIAFCWLGSHALPPIWWKNEITVRCTTTCGTSSVCQACARTKWIKSLPWSLQSLAKCIRERALEGDSEETNGLLLPLRTAGLMALGSDSDPLFSALFHEII